MLYNCPFAKLKTVGTDGNSTQKISNFALIRYLIIDKNDTFKNCFCRYSVCRHSHCGLCLKMTPTVTKTTVWRNSEKVMQNSEIETFYPTCRNEWRQWLEKNHDTSRAVWLIYYKMKSGVPTISWSEAVDEALCFGWIDSVTKSLDDERFMQFFCKRKPNSGWSKINKGKLQRLIAEGLMTPAGYASIERAKQNGSWTLLDEVEELTIPEDLEAAFNTRPGSGDFFLSLSKSVRKSILQWIVLAKRPETRQKRINEIAELAAQKLKPKQF